MAKKAMILIDKKPLDEFGGDLDLALGPPKGKMKQLLAKAKNTPPMQVEVDFSKPLVLPEDIEKLLMEWIEGK
jgi:hypothetical protein